VQPVATCRQSPYRHKPAIVKLLLLLFYTKRVSITPSQPQIRRPLPSPPTFWS